MQVNRPRSPSPPLASDTPPEAAGSAAPAPSRKRKAEDTPHDSIPPLSPAPVNPPGDTAAAAASFRKRPRVDLGEKRSSLATVTTRKDGLRLLGNFSLPGTPASRSMRHLPVPLVPGRGISAHTATIDSEAAKRRKAIASSPSSPSSDAASSVSAEAAGAAGPAVERVPAVRARDVGLRQRAVPLSRITQHPGILRDDVKAFEAAAPGTCAPYTLKRLLHHFADVPAKLRAPLLLQAIRDRNEIGGMEVLGTVFACAAALPKPEREPLMVQLGAHFAADAEAAFNHVTDQPASYSDVLLPTVRTLAQVFEAVPAALQRALVERALKLPRPMNEFSVYRPLQACADKLPAEEGQQNLAEWPGLHLADGLRQAFQMVATPVAGHPVSLEATVRALHKDFDLVPVDEKVPLLEQALALQGTPSDLGRFRVLDDCVKQLPAPLRGPLHLQVQNGLGRALENAFDQALSRPPDAGGLTSLVSALHADFDRLAAEDKAPLILRALRLQLHGGTFDPGLFRLLDGCARKVPLRTREVVRGQVGQQLTQCFRGVSEWAAAQEAAQPGNWAWTVNALADHLDLVPDEERAPLMRHVLGFQGMPFSVAMLRRLDDRMGQLPRGERQAVRDLMTGHMAQTLDQELLAVAAQGASNPEGLVTAARTLRDNLDRVGDAGLEGLIRRALGTQRAQFDPRLFDLLDECALELPQTLRSPLRDEIAAQCRRDIDGIFDAIAQQRAHDPAALMASVDWMLEHIGKLPADLQAVMIDRASAFQYPLAQIGKTDRPGVFDRLEDLARKLPLPLPEQAAALERVRERFADSMVAVLQGLRANPASMRDDKGSVLTDILADFSKLPPARREEVARLVMSLPYGDADRENLDWVADAGLEGLIRRAVDIQRIRFDPVLFRLLDQCALQMPTTLRSPLRDAIAAQCRVEIDWTFDAIAQQRAHDPAVLMASVEWMLERIGNLPANLQAVMIDRASDFRYTLAQIGTTDRPGIFDRLGDLARTLPFPEQATALERVRERFADSMVAVLQGLRANPASMRDDTGAVLTDILADFGKLPPARREEVLRLAMSLPYGDADNNEIYQALGRGSSLLPDDVRVGTARDLLTTARASYFPDRPNNAEGDRLRESDRRDEQDFGYFHALCDVLCRDIPPVGGERLIADLMARIDLPDRPQDLITTSWDQAAAKLDPAARAEAFGRILGPMLRHVPTDELMAMWHDPCTAHLVALGATADSPLMAELAAQLAAMKTQRPADLATWETLERTLVGIQAAASARLDTDEASSGDSEAVPVRPAT